MALDVLGYAEDHPLRQEAVRQFDSLMVNDQERFFFQPCFSPVWDTAIAVYCHHGPRSRQAAGRLVQKGFTRVYNVDGGVDAYARQVDPKVPTY
jgi:rhodanese-related sulfurtransferase